MKLHANLNNLLRDNSSKSEISISFLAEIAIGLWRMGNSLRLESSDSSDLKSKRSWKHLQRLFTLLEKKGITIQDKTGEIYDMGMRLRVVSAEERADFKNELIIETITPTVFHQKNIIHAGEVIVGKPTAKKN